MSLLTMNRMSQGLVLAGSLSLYEGTALAQTPHQSHPEGRAGLATLCIEKRSYVDPLTKAIVTPPIYLSEVPPGGIDTLYVEGGPVAQEWKKFLNPADEKTKEWLADTGIPDQAETVFDLMKLFDKDKNGIVTREEFEKGPKEHEGLKRPDILAYFVSLRCSSLYLTKGALNTVQLDSFPEVGALKKNVSDAKKENEKLKGSFQTHQAKLTAEIDVLKTDSASKDQALETYRSLFFTWRGHTFARASLGTGLLAGAILGAGAMIALNFALKKRRKKAMAPAPEQKPTPPPQDSTPPPKAAVPPQKASTPPEPEAKAEAKVETSIDDDDMDGVLKDLAEAKGAASGPQP